MEVLDFEGDDNASVQSLVLQSGSVSRSTDLGARSGIRLIHITAPRTTRRGETVPLTMAKDGIPEWNTQSTLSKRCVYRR